MPGRFGFTPILYANLQEVAKRVTEGRWETNCASEIFAPIDGEMIRIGHFQGCVADAQAVVEILNKLRNFEA